MNDVTQPAHAMRHADRLRETRQAIIAMAVRKFMAGHAMTLQWLPVTEDDITQQAWAEWLHLERQWPTNPGRFLVGRLIDWMQGLQRYNKPRKHAPVVLSFADVPEGSAPVVDPDTSVMLRQFLEHVRVRKPRAGVVFKKLLEGCTLKEAGAVIGVSESRVSQMRKEVIGEFQASIGGVCS